MTDSRPDSKRLAVAAAALLVLLVSSLYESFILEEEGLLSELITSEYLDLSLSHAPRVTRVSTHREAIAFVQNQPVDLVITMAVLCRRPRASRPSSSLAMASSV